jgi:ankyrin repeat protein
MCKQCGTVTIHALIRDGKPLQQILDELDSRFTVNERSPCGKTPLMSAAYYGRKDVMEALIQRGAVVNALDERTSDTAAHYVAHSNSGHIRQCACLMVLIENGASIDLENNDGFTVYELADKNGNKDISTTGGSNSLMM